jgi:hypothetical protein
VTAHAIGIEVARISAHFRTDLRQGQAELLTKDFIEDLGRFRVPEIQEAFAAYRRDPASKFFPRPAHIIAIIEQNRRETSRLSRISDKPPQFGESRPLMWWMLPCWQDHWREGEIPEEHRQAWARRNARQAAKP